MIKLEGDPVPEDLRQRIEARVNEMVRSCAARGEPVPYNEVTIHTIAGIIDNVMRDYEIQFYVPCLKVKVMKPRPSDIYDRVIRFRVIDQDYEMSRHREWVRVREYFEENFELTDHEWEVLERTVKRGSSLEEVLQMMGEG